MSIIKKRIGRLNVVECFSDGISRKTSLITESHRPKRLLRESLVLQTAKSYGVNVPNVLEYGIDTYGREYVVTQLIDGFSFLNLQHINLREAFSKIGPQMLKLQGGFLGNGWLNGESKRGEYNSWREFVTNFYQRYNTRITNPDIRAALDEFSVGQLIQKLISEPDKPFIIHRDIKPRNLIIRHDHTVWVIDWENTLLGDPLFEIAQFGANFGHGMWWKALAQGYNLDISKPNYILYEIVALTGIVAFCEQHFVPNLQRRKRLKQQLSEIKSHL